MTGGLPLLRAMSRGSSPARAMALLRLRRAWRRSEALREEYGRRLGAPVPEALVLSLTTRCPEACAFCVSAGQPAGLDLPGETAVRLVAEAEALGTFAVVLAGGEPLLRTELAFRLVDRHPRLLFLLFTGGAGLDRDVARRARAAHVLTLVGADRGRTRADGARRELARAGAAFGFSAVVTEESAPDLASRGFVEGMRREGCRAGVLIERMPVGRAVGQGYGLSSASRVRFREEIRAREREVGIPLRFFPEGEDEFGGCAAAGRGVLHVNAAGGVEPCPFIHVSDGSVADRPLAEVLRSPFLRAVRAEAGRSPGRPCALLENRAIGGRPAGPAEGG